MAIDGETADCGVEDCKIFGPGTRFFDFLYFLSFLCFLVGFFSFGCLDPVGFFRSFDFFAFKLKNQMRLNKLNFT